MFTRRLQLLVAFAMLTLILQIAVSPASAAERPAPARVSEEVQAIAKSNNEFAFALYDQLRKDGGNIFFSPTSISTALAMTYAGAEGETEKEMAKTLEFTLPKAKVHSAFASMMVTLNAPERDAYELRMANRLWGQTGYGFLPKYLAITSKNYGAELAQVDFINAAEQSRKEINVWVEKQTNEKITDLIPQGSVNSLTRLVLTNAIYFKGKWEHEFDKKATENALFTLSADEQIAVPLMFQKERFKYGVTAELQLLEMPYKGDNLIPPVSFCKSA